MKIIQSLWTLPMKKGHEQAVNNRFHGGWLHYKYHLMSWAYSCLQLRSLYDEVELVTDRHGKKLLVDLLELPYTTTNVLLDDLDQCNPELWALGKFYAFSAQDTPFIHVDGDVFLWERFPERLETAELIAQNLEHDFPIYSLMMDDLIKGRCHIPKVIWDNFQNNGLLDAYNAGIIGGNNMEFFREYVKEALHFVEANHTRLKTIPVGMFNTFYEQHLYYCMAEKKQIRIECFSGAIEQSELNYSLKGVHQFKNAPHSTSYIHLFGEDAKKDPEICGILSGKLKMAYPHYHDRIMNIVREVEPVTI